ncbi:kinesin-like protein KIF20B [Plodia interpunctella]|uniref:kinesin-like protein KIF20B n=1 Tax=Plodia interpunctella TaxID=58824 RepID=UPI00236829BB|nr:kinesin-like protein KIF20B [Plodia interpunctella]
MLEQRFSDNDRSKRDIPSFIEPRPPLVSNPFMRPRPQKGTNLLELFEEDSECEEPELVQVYLRLKPYHGQSNLYEVRSEKCLITSVDTATAGHGRRTQHNVSKVYTFSHIFDSETTQKEIFEHVVKDNLKKLPEGHNFTLLTYGASGSGKTYTLMGTVASPGLVPRSLEYVFRVVDAAQIPVYKPSDGGADKLNYAEQDYELQWVKRLRQISAPLRDKYRRMSAGLCSDFAVSTLDLTNRIQYYVWVSFVEIYNEGIYDLLASSDRRISSKLKIREDTNGNVYVKGATQAFVRTGEEAYDVLVAGKHNLQVAATGVHAHSSRSHCIFTITMLTETDNGVRTSCVRLCDLAGCERARRTRNAGARLQESRHINSSLHVLERCLHALRRKQKHRGDAVVPYRESKLTRLLGAGLSGARAEAVGMVVTLNPAPEYQHETRHVLQLAAVARDIQVNNTIAESILESAETTQDTTYASSAEVMKLRADNERLHFELIQAQSRNKELLAAMEERQQAAADTMRELVEEAKDITRQYYEAQIQALKSEMDDMVEEYECRLKKDAAPPANTGTPSRALQNKVAQLMTEIAILEEQLIAEKLARARAEEEVQHLRACIDERDEKEDETLEKQEDAMNVSDSEQDGDEEINDPCNESLEPTFKKDDINRSKLILQSINSNNTSHNTTINSEKVDNDDDDDDDIQDKSNNTIRNDSSDDTELSINGESIKIGNETLGNDSHIGKNVSCESNDILNKSNNNEVRGTYFVRKSEDNSMDISTKDLNTIDNVRGTYFISNTTPQDDSLKSNEIELTNENTTSEVHKHDRSITKDAHIKSNVVDSTKDGIDINGKDSALTTSAKKVHKDSVVTKIMRSVKSTHSGDSSLTQFENLEMAANYCEETRCEENTSFANIKMLAQKKTYFSDSPITNNDPVLEDQQIMKTVVDKNIKDNKKTDIEKNVNNIAHGFKKKVSLVDTPAVSLGDNSFIGEDLIKTNIIKEKRTYFDNIDVNINTNKHLEAVKDVKLEQDDIRSPSIVKDDIEETEGFEPNTIKKLLGESLTRQPDVISSVHKNKILTKKHDSVDIFDGYDSPHVVKTKELSVIDKARKSIERMVTEQKSASKHQDCIKKEIFERKSIPEEPINYDKIVASSVKVENLNDVTALQYVTFGNNTTEDFENLCKDITAPRETEFEIIAKEIDDRNTENEKITEKSVSFKRELKDAKEHKKVLDTSDNSNSRSEFEEVKYNLRKKSSFKIDKKLKDETEEVVNEGEAKCENKIKSKRSLRLRKRRNQDEDMDGDKLKDIVNLQKEFSDVTLDVPAASKVVKDIPSPEKVAGEENEPPLGIQSCPSKSAARSRRKLFTPRAEPLDESAGAADSCERLCVPRPSYHRARARRKL